MQQSSRTTHQMSSGGMGGPNGGPANHPNNSSSSQGGPTHPNQGNSNSNNPNKSGGNNPLANAINSATASANNHNNLAGGISGGGNNSGNNPLANNSNLQGGGGLSGANNAANSAAALMGAGTNPGQNVHQHHAQSQQMHSKIVRGILQGSPLSFMIEGREAPPNGPSTLHDNGGKQTHVQAPIDLIGEPSVQFSYAHAIVWQIKFLISSYLTKKVASQTQAELQYLSNKFGADFDKYLIKELIEQIDLKDPNKVSKDKNEAVKSQLLSQELSRCSQKPEFLKYFDDIAQGVYGDRYSEFLAELARRLKLGPKMQLLIALSLAESCAPTNKPDCYALLKQKLREFVSAPKAETLDEYALTRLNYLFNVQPELFSEVINNSSTTDQSFQQGVKAALMQQAHVKSNQSVALRIAQNQGDLIGFNPSVDDPSNSLIKVGSDFESLTNVGTFLQPWEVLLDLGHYSSFDYQVLSMALQDFKDINERVMANTILHLALNHTGQDSLNSRIAFNTFKTNKLGDMSLLKKEPSDKSTTLSWYSDSGHFARAFRENFSNLNWLRVFEEFGELGDEEISKHIDLEKKAYLTLMQIFNKSKPQNLQVPISFLLERKWKNPALQFSFLKNAIECYCSRDDKTFNFQAISQRKIQPIAEVNIGAEVSQSFIDVWSQPEVLEILVMLSESTQYQQVRNLLQDPIHKVPEYLILTISKCKFNSFQTQTQQQASQVAADGSTSAEEQMKDGVGHVLLDEVLSALMPQFLTNNTNSIPVLKKLWEFNEDLMIRGICETCRHEQRVMNLSRVLDITQEIKDSLIKIVYCQDYEFVVNLGILAGKRDFLHYDVWLKERIKKVGTPFVRAFIKYISEQVLTPCKEYMVKNNILGRSLGQDEQDSLEKARDQILERSHLTKERLCITMEHLENPANFQALTQKEKNNEQATNMRPDAGGALVRISQETQRQIKDLTAQYAILFPKQVSPTQSTEEIDKAANEYFQHIFSAEAHQVDERIKSLIVTLQNFQRSQVVKEQEIYACVLHGLFDEYRFLHKYPQPFLQRIAKLFGAIIKNKLLNDVLQGIALKFVIEAFRREGKRLMFGIIVVKEFFECLPDFPKQFQEIYTNREKIRIKEPELHFKLEQLYEQTLGASKDSDKVAAPPSSANTVPSSGTNANSSSVAANGTSQSANGSNIGAADQSATQKIAGNGQQNGASNLTTNNSNTAANQRSTTGNNFQGMMTPPQTNSDGDKLGGVSKEDAAPHRFSQSMFPSFDPDKVLRKDNNTTTSSGNQNQNQDANSLKQQTQQRAAGGGMGGSNLLGSTNTNLQQTNVTGGNTSSSFDQQNVASVGFQPGPSSSSALSTGQPLKPDALKFTEFVTGQQASQQQNNTTSASGKVSGANNANADLSQKTDTDFKFGPSAINKPTLGRSNEFELPEMSKSGELLKQSNNSNAASMGNQQQRPLTPGQQSGTNPLQTNQNSVMLNQHHQGVGMGRHPHQNNSSSHFNQNSQSSSQQPNQMTNQQQQNNPRAQTPNAQGNAMNQQPLSTNQPAPLHSASSSTQQQHQFATMQHQQAMQQKQQANNPNASIQMKNQQQQVVGPNGLMSSTNTSGTVGLNNTMASGQAGNGQPKMAMSHPNNNVANQQNSMTAAQAQQHQHHLLAQQQQQQMHHKHQQIDSQQTQASQQAQSYLGQFSANPNAMGSGLNPQNNVNNPLQQQRNNLFDGSSKLSSKAKSFRPKDLFSGATIPPSVMNQQQKEQKQITPASLLQQKVINQEHLVWQQALDLRIQEAKATKQTRMRLEDLIDDPSLKQPTQHVIDQIRLKCNNTGKNNFKQNLEYIRDLVLPKPVDEKKAKEAQKAAAASTTTPASQSKDEDKKGTETSGEAGDTNNSTTVTSNTTAAGQAVENGGEKSPATKQAEVVAEKDVNLNWFLNYILTKRISAQNQTQHHIYIELIRQLGHRESVSRTIDLGIQIFQRCMLIDESEFNKIANKVASVQQASQVKQYLKTLGSFLGSLTLAKNRPLNVKEFDLKQLLVHGFQHESRRVVIAFVSSILKEATKSIIFKITNPWLFGILQVFREIVELMQQPQMKNAKDVQEIEMEIAVLFKAFNINYNEIPPSGLLSALKKGHYSCVPQEIELSFMNSKGSVIPIRQRTSSPPPNGPGGVGATSSDFPMGLLGGPDETLWEMNGSLNEGLRLLSDGEGQIREDRIVNLKFIFMNVSISEERKAFLKSKFEITDQQVREYATRAIDESIEEILKQVIDRSVTISLITAKELVFKDFALDGDPKRIMTAAEQIVQNLAGQLAHVTCREPLRMNLINCLYKYFKLACFNAGSTSGLHKAQPYADMTPQAEQEMQQRERALNFYIQDYDDYLHEMAQETCKENLELGCKIIRQASYDSSLLSVKNDVQILEAVEARKRAQENNEKSFVDQEQASKIADLPPQLRPDPNGLSKDEIQVYSDFEKLNFKTKFDNMSLQGLPGVSDMSEFSLPGENGTGANGSLQGGALGSLRGSEASILGGQGADGKKQQPVVTYDFTLDSILKRIDEAGKIDSVSQSLFSLKMDHLSKKIPSKQTDQEAREVAEVSKKLLDFCENKLQKIASCKSGEDTSENEPIQLAKIIKLCVSKFTQDQLSKKLLTEVFLKMEDMYVLDADLTILLLSQNVFSPVQWDINLANYLKNAPGSLQLEACKFFREIVKKCIFEKKIFGKEQIPNLIQYVEQICKEARVSETQSDMVQMSLGDTMHLLRSLAQTDQEHRLKQYYLKWVQLSQIDDSVEMQSNSADAQLQDKQSPNSAKQQSSGSTTAGNLSANTSSSAAATSGDMRQEQEINKYFDEMSRLGIDKDEQILFTFCKVMVKESIELSTNTWEGARRPNNYTLDYRFIDSFIKLVLCLLTSFDINKLQFMQKIFEFIRAKLHEDHNAQNTSFNQKPYYRMLMNIMRATMSEYFSSEDRRQILLDLASLLNDLCPENYPAFAFAWLELVSHKLFMSYFLKVQTLHPKQVTIQTVTQLIDKHASEKSFGAGPDPNVDPAGFTLFGVARNEAKFHLTKLNKMKDLIMSCFSFMKQNLIAGSQSSPAMRSFYTATMNVVLVVLKDYPQFLCDFHFNFVNALPDNAVQLRNMILAAFPKHVQPPAPFQQGLKVDPMQEQMEPRILSNFESYLTIASAENAQNNLKKDLDQLLDLLTNSAHESSVNDGTLQQKRASLVECICKKLMNCKERVNGKIVPSSSVSNAVVLYIAKRVCQKTKLASGKGESLALEKESIELFKEITVKLSDETRVTFLNSIVNELRYPNSHTYFFCLILLQLFAYSKTNNIQEQISTILFERLQALRPYPWGLMISFRELIQNQKYGFMRSPFIATNQDAIKNLFANKDRLRPFFQFLPQKQPQIPIGGLLGSQAYAGGNSAAASNQSIGVNPGQPQPQSQPTNMGQFGQFGAQNATGANVGGGVGVGLGSSQQQQFMGALQSAVGVQQQTLDPLGATHPGQFQGANSQQPGAQNVGSTPSSQNPLTPE